MVFTLEELGAKPAKAEDGRPRRPSDWSLAKPGDFKKDSVVATKKNRPKCSVPRRKSRV